MTYYFKIYEVIDNPLSYQVVLEEPKLHYNRFDDLVAAEDFLADNGNDYTNYTIVKIYQTEI